METDRLTVLEDRLAELEAEVQRLRDLDEIAQLVTSYGMLVDSGCDMAVGEIWTTEGIYDVDEIMMSSRQEIIEMVRGPGHQRWIAGGCAHFLGPARIQLDGDRATATCHSLMVVCEDEKFLVRRASANHWELERTPQGWRVLRRISRVLDGRDESPTLLATALGAERFRLQG